MNTKYKFTGEAKFGKDEAEQEDERKNTIVLNKSQRHLHTEFESAGKKVVYSVTMPI